MIYVTCIQAADWFPSDS